MLALDQFRRMAQALIDGRYGQPALTTAAPAADWHAWFDAFAESLLEDGHPAPLTVDRFFSAARALLRRIAALAAGPDAPEDTVFLEKTPHNLLAISFLARLAPGANFLHVMRDPRSIAWSLLSMRWGPDELITAASWVDSYCRAWTGAEAEAARLGLTLTRLHIEDAAAAPSRACTYLTGRLGITPCDNLFAGADTEVLNRWTAKADSSQRALLDTRLGGWVAHFGYEPERIGHRPCASLPRCVEASKSAPALAPSNAADTVAADTTPTDAAPQRRVPA